MKNPVPLVLAVALLMEQMDSTVIATSLPAIAADIGTSPVALKLALTSYLVALAIFIPVSAWMADRFGAKRVFRAAIIVFVTGSVLCALAGSLVEFVAARFLEGMGGAMMTPVGRLVLVRATPKNELVAAMAWLSIPALIGPLIGPPIGGFITTYFSWHWIFLINVPIGIVGVWIAGRVLPDIEPAGSNPLDVTGFLLAGLAASGIVFGLSVVSLPALPPSVGAVTLAAGLAAAGLYLRHARRSASPILDPRLFSNPVFRAAVAGGTIFRIGNGAVPFLMPLLFQVGFGMTPFESGLLTFVAAFGAISMKFLAPFTLRTGGFRTVLIAASLIAGGLIALSAAFRADTPAIAIVVVLLTAGFVRSLFFTAVNALVFADIEPGEMAQATAIAAVSQQFSIALGVALAGGILEGAALVGGEATSPQAFSVAFLSIGAITGLAALPFLSMSRNAGASVSGHVAARGPDGDPTQPI